jgi:hypothetical protein
MARVLIREGCFNGRSLEHRDGPVVSQAGLVVAQLLQGRWARFEHRQACVHVVVEQGQVGEKLEKSAARELLGDGADAKERSGCERDATFEVRPAPGVAGDDVAVFENGNRAAGAWVGVGELL